MSIVKYKKSFTNCYFIGIHGNGQGKSAKLINLALLIIIIKYVFFPIIVKIHCYE